MIHHTTYDLQPTRALMSLLMLVIMTAASVMALSAL